MAPGRDLAGALARAHARGVLRRDLEPHDVLFGEDGASRLADFGLARLRGARSLTEAGTALGTPVYMAPEQAGGLEQLDERADVYGPGALLYRAVT